MDDDEALPEPVLLPCGCLITPCIEDDQHTLKISPCRQDCEYLTYMLAEGEAAGARVEWRPA